MNKKIIKIAFDGFWPTFKYTENEFFNYLVDEGLVEVDQFNPDIIIYSDYKSKYKLSTRRILYSPENIKRNDWFFKYGMTYESNSKYNFKFLNFFYYPFFKEVSENLPTKKYLSLKNKKKKKYMNFIYSNKKAVLRDKYFHYVSKISKIDSYGRHLNNMGKLPDTNFPEGQKIELISAYKYTIAFENSSGKSYMSEKIWQPLSVNSIPLYFGSNEVFNIFNKKKIIYISDEKNFSSSIKKINAINNSKDLYSEILAEPIFKDENTRIMYSYQSLAKDFLYFLERVMQDKKNIEYYPIKFLSFYFHKFIKRLKI